MRRKRLSAGGIPFRREDGAVLVLRAYKNGDFPKGLVEPGETPFEAARRELRWVQPGVADTMLGERLRAALAWAEGLKKKRGDNYSHGSVLSIWR